MVNKTGGKSHRKNKKGGEIIKTQTPYAESDDTLRYGQVLKKSGGNRVVVTCSDSIERSVVIPGSFYKRVWLNPSDIVLVQISNVNKNDSFILYKYNSSEIRDLKSKNLLSFATKTKTESTNDGTVDISFEDEENTEINNDEDDIIEDENEEITKTTDNKTVKKETQKIKVQARQNDRNKKNDVDINDVPKNISWDDL